MPAADLESLLSPLADDAPCGADLEYDPAFLSLQEAAAGKPEQQYGDTVIAAEAPDWQAVHEQALQLAARTRDLRVATWLARSAAHVEGLPGAVHGLRLVQGLVQRHWEHVHPQLDASDNNDPTARMNALSPLVHPSAGLADLRAASLTGKRGALTVRDIELALSHAEPLPGETVPTEDGVVQGVTDALAQTPGLAEDMQQGLAAVQGLSAVLEQRVNASASPELAPLAKLMQRVADAARLANGQAVEPAGVQQGTAAAPSRGLGAISSREDAIRALDRVAEWIERNEPSNPAPLLIRRSQRLMSKNFIDIIRDLVPDGLNQIEKLAGTSNS
ncbi:type VI secretion system protein TssA [Piscinibacter terrae]|uniref:Type VI secretion system protein TssA n=1 Tax=Piscinibacter terrae TaxID=2496871 RepID=A0A3N7HSY7_9BURK|nr:type VI secretion system protein TssA [Albitalea terrae]RQP25410.1 type VI secretion system protein TssA [Albitalea terrae]